MRRFGLITLALLAGIALTAGVASAAEVKVVGKATSGLGDTIRTQVRSAPGSTVTVWATGSTFDRGTFAVAAKRRVRIGARGKRTVGLRVTAAGRREAAGCQALAVTVLARGKGGAGGTRFEVRRSRSCIPKPVDLTRAKDCDFIAQPKEGMCMLPFPNDYYTVRDTASPTGKRIHFTEDAMPRNRNGIPIAPATYSDSDGFSQGAGIVVKIPGVENAAAVAENRMVPINHLGRYTERNQRVLVIDTRTGKRWPIWAETDSNAATDSDRVLEIKPAVNFRAKGRYIVALRNLTDEAGDPLPAPGAFRFYRDGIRSGQPRIERRRAHFESIFRTLRKAKVKRSSLYLAWDFTVASDENNYRRVLSMRDRAFAELGDTNMGDNVIEPGSAAPDFTVDSVTEYTPAQNSRVARRIKGHYTVPCFLVSTNANPDCGPGSVMDLDEQRLPIRHGNWNANFECILPQVAMDGSGGLRPMVFGHGLLGRADGVTGSVNPLLANDHRMLVCATDEIGMAGDDPAEVILALMDLSKFRIVPDRLAQGILNELFLARLMYHPDGLGTDPAFQVGGESVIDTQAVYYMGASQGGIMGGALTAVSPDFTRASLLVGAMNYSTLLPRSIDFDLYAGFMYPAYRDQMARPLIFSLIQMLWDRSEPNGYAHRMTGNPPPNTPRHEVTLQIALGDFQVSNFASEVEARTVGMATNGRPLDPGRWPDYDVLWNVPRIRDSEYPYRGSNIIYFDGGPMRPDPNDPNKTIGTPVPPFTNIAPRIGQDPHGAPGGASVAVQMTSDFLKPNGGIENICAPKSCYGDSWAGMP